VENFANMMNEKAIKLGLNNTHFVTPHGLDQDEHYTTAYELAKITKYALDKPEFRKIVGTKTYTITIDGNARTINNTNELLGTLNGVYGVKTGFTNNAGRCLVTSTKRGNLDIICVVLGADTKKIRTQDSVKLIEYACKNYEIIDIEEIINKEFIKWKEKELYTIKIEKAQKSNIILKLSYISNKKIPIKTIEKNNIDIKIECNKDFIAPIEANYKIGKLTASIKGNNIVELDIMIEKQIEKKGVWDYILQLLSQYNNCFEKLVNRSQAF